MTDWGTHFDYWWELYPKKVGKDPARKAFFRVLGRRVNPADLLDGLHRYRAYWKAEKTESQYILHPATWLNQGRWTDVLTVLKKASPYDLIMSGALDGNTGASENPSNGPRLKSVEAPE